MGDLLQVYFQVVADVLPGLGVLAESFLQGAAYDLCLRGCFQLPTAGVFSCIHNNDLLTVLVLWHISLL